MKPTETPRKGNSQAETELLNRQVVAFEFKTWKAFDAGLGLVEKQFKAIASEAESAIAERKAV